MFCAITTEAYTVRTVLDILRKFSRNAKMTFSSAGIEFLVQDDRPNCGCLIHIILHANRFDRYTATFSGIREYVVNLSSLFVHLESVKSKDFLKIELLEHHPNQMILTVETRDRKRVSKSTMHVQNPAHETVDIPRAFKWHVGIPVVDFCRTCKELQKAGVSIRVDAYPNSIVFSTHEDESEREIRFTDLSVQDQGAPDTAPVGTPIRYIINEKSIVRLHKLSTLHKGVLTLSTSEADAMRVQSMAGSLGSICIYIPRDTAQPRDHVPHVTHSHLRVPTPESFELY